MIPTWIIGVGIVVVALGVAWGVRNQINGLLGVGQQGIDTAKPTIWWYVDDSQANGREWLDFQQRGTREPNEPYLKICQARALYLWGDSWNVVPVIGRMAALQRLREAGAVVPEGVERTPPALWMTWCRTSFLATLGGLWMDGSAIPLGSGRSLHERVAGASAMAFGVDPDEALASTAAGPGVAAGWAATPGQMPWTAMATALNAQIAAGAQSWSAFEARRSIRRLWADYGAGIKIDRKAEVSRDLYGGRLELDTLLGATEWTNGTTDGGLWVPLPDGRDGLERATPWLWFTRMSVEQIRESDFVWSRLSAR